MAISVICSVGAMLIERKRAPIHKIVRSLHNTMRTNIDIDDQLMRQAMRSSGAKTKRAVVEEGLRLLIQTRGQASLRRLRGKVAWQGDLHSSRLERLPK